jgi:ABC-type antimicrobial peptide transport system ATPase subunit
MKPDDYLSIGEFARIVGIAPHSLRKYDKKGLFSPAVRRRKLENDYRYYAPMQITTIKMIRVLSKIGVPHGTQAANSHACLFISHDLDVVCVMSDRIAVLHEGRIVETGTTDRVLDNPQHAYTNPPIRQFLRGYMG